MIFQLDSNNLLFPDQHLADEDGLLAIGGDLRVDRLLIAYSHGIFPWYSEETPILWYAPHERFVLNPLDIKISKSMAKIIKSDVFQITFNKCFAQVIENCSSIVRFDQDGTWIVQDMKNAYNTLHKLGFAHSIEVWKDNTLVGGLYGVLVGKVFCGESMFSKVSNASKAALIYLSKSFDLELIDCQIHSDHLESMGARMIDSRDFYKILDNQSYDKEGLRKLFKNNVKLQ